MKSIRQNLFLAIKYINGFFKIGIANRDGAINLADIFVGETSLADMQKFSLKLKEAFDVLGIEMTVKFMGAPNEIPTAHIGSPKKKQKRLPSSTRKQPIVLRPDQTE